MLIFRLCALYIIPFLSKFLIRIFITLWRSCNAGSFYNTKNNFVISFLFSCPVMSFYFARFYNLSQFIFLFFSFSIISCFVYPCQILYWVRISYLKVIFLRCIHCCRSKIILKWILCIIYMFVSMGFFVISYTIKDSRWNNFWNVWLMLSCFKSMYIHV